MKKVAFLILCRRTPISQLFFKTRDELASLSKPNAVYMHLNTLAITRFGAVSVESKG